ncbi:hypothetical protein F9B74_01650 [Pelistega sp. NLN82]|uniref:Uncharacterized protein n=1 Tax=Pelistega ratti TaxID=2652177 RepID=A0A6L9Y3N0_9BURK|nr:hypothetical protein [Pelistega ratti]NEN75030.1 hypothetical protein [Pelistega ratti]
MKSIGKILLLLFFVGFIVIGIWKVVDLTLFGESDMNSNDPVTINSPIVMSLPHQEDPRSISAEEAFSNTTSDTVVSQTLSCQEVYTLIEQFYTLRMNDSDIEMALAIIQQNENMPDQDVTSFEHFVKTLWDTPKNEIKPLKEVEASINDLCKKAN